MKKKVIAGVAMVIVVLAVVLTCICRNNGDSDDTSSEQTNAPTLVSEQGDDDSISSKDVVDEDGNVIVEDGNGDNVSGDNVNSSAKPSTDNLKPSDDNNSQTDNGNKDYDSDADVDVDDNSEEALHGDKDIPSEAPTDNTDNGGNFDNKDNTAATAPASVKKTEYTVEIKKLTMGSDVNIEYPVISGWDKDDKQKEWNEVFKKNASFAQSLMSDGDSYELKYELKTKNDNVLSILGKGSVHIKNAAYGTNICVTYNIDMKTGKNITLFDDSNIDDIVEKLTSSKDEDVTVNPDEKKSACTLGDILSYYSSDEAKLSSILKSKLKGYDVLQTDSNQVCSGYSYRQDDKVYLVMEVSHALGDFAIVKIN